MCTAVVGGSIHRAATRISAASDQRSTTPMTSHRIKDRRKPVPSGVLVCVFGIAVTFRNNSLGWVITTNGEIAGDKRIHQHLSGSERPGTHAQRSCGYLTNRASQIHGRKMQMRHRGNPAAHWAI